MSDIMQKLQAPFPPEDIEWRVGSTNSDKTKGLALAYVTNRAIQNRLDEVFGVFGWRNEFREWKGSSQICGISIYNNGEWITKWDGADDSNMEATKGGLSDAMKRAGYQWGIGRYLYKLPDFWMPLKNGKYLDGEPNLPEWALPYGYVQKSQKPPQQNKPSGNDNHQPEPQQGGKMAYKCHDCQGDVTPTRSKTVAEIIADSQKFHKLDLCQKCINARYKLAHPEVK